VRTRTEEGTVSKLERLTAKFRADLDDGSKAVEEAEGKVAEMKGK